MSNAEKLLQAMQQNLLDWRIEQLHTVMEAHGIEGGNRAAVMSHSAIPMGRN